VQEPDVVLVLTEQAMEMYATIESKIPVFYDTTLLKTRVGDNLYGYPFTELASKLGHVGTANIIALGAMAAKTDMVQIESLALALKRRFSGKVAEMNIKALNIGVELVKNNN
jgi:2-oxoglutarate ferredoxin oxidoreductase subunit gamma